MSDDTTAAKDGAPAVDAAAEDEQSLITPAMQAAIGVETEPFTIELTAELVSRLAEALEVEDPELQAVLARDEVGAELPPWAVLTHYGRLRPGAVPDAPERGLQAADEFTILGPIRLGDRLTIVQRLADVQERIGGRVGHSLFVHHEWDYTNQAGEIVARTRRTRAHFIGKHSNE